MSSVVQTTYRPQIPKAVNGLVIDEGGFDVATRPCATAAGIGYGLAVSQESDRDAILGGDTFLGISVRDTTQNGVKLSPLNDGLPATTDKYDERRSVAVLTRGRAWVTADSAVAANGAVYYDYVTGELGGSASGQAATGWISFSNQPAAGDTITLNGTAITFKASGANGTTELNIRQSLAATVNALVALLNASTDENINDATYEAYPGELGGQGAYQINISHDTPGTGGNSYSLAKSCAAATLSGSTLSGGFAATAATGDIAFSANPEVNSTITLNGVVVTFIAGATSFPNIHIETTLALTLDGLVTALNGTGNAEIAKCTYSATGAPHDTLHIVSDTTGQAMNSWTMAASSSPDSHGTPSGPTLSGGAPASVLAANAVWLTSALAGDLAVVSLGLQR